MWTVKAGIIPGEERLEYTKVWEYTAIEYDKDRDDEPYDHVFNRKRAEAMDYYLQVSQPTVTSWAELKFMWY